MATDARPSIIPAKVVNTPCGFTANLYTADEVRALRREEDDDLVRIVDWCENFLGKPHGLVGRSGNVCPFVPEAMVRGSLKFAVVSLSGKSAAISEIEEAIVSCREHFLATERGNGKIDI